MSTPSRIVLPLRTAERFPILLHQDREDLLAHVDAELEERVLRVGQGAEHRKRDLDGHRLRKIDELEVRGLAGMLGHGGSFVVWLPRPYHTDGEGAAALNSSVQQVLGHPPISRVDGLLETKKIIGMAEAHYAQFAPHLFAGPIEAAANIQMSACSPDFLMLESIETFPDFFSGLLNKPIQWEEGYVIVPDEPGLGFELNEEVCDANPYTSDDVFPPMATEPL